MAANEGNPLPEFERPPVVEVALSMQFERITTLRTPQIGLLWQEFRDRFPTSEEHAPLDAAFERFGISRAQKGVAHFQLLQSPPVSRCWFLNREGTELIQIQQDRIAHNWRKVEGGADYPRYENIKATFGQELKRFHRFLDRERLGRLVPNQCEVTYVNHIVSNSDVWDNHGDLSRVFTALAPRDDGDFLPPPEDGQLSLRFVINDESGQPLGRLHAAIEAAYRSSDEAPMFVLTLTARGRPIGEGISGAFGFLDIGREWVVRGFASLTTDDMHRIWRRRR